MIKAGIFDIGGVLLDWSNRPMFDDIINTLQITDEVLAKYWDAHIRLLGEGKITEDEFWKRFIKDANVTVALPKKSLFLREFEKRFHVNEDVRDIVKAMAKQGYPVALLSNTIDPHLSFMRTTHLFDLFDVLIFSNEVGYEKPAPEIYQAALEKLHVKAEETLFVDDLLENVEGANAVGIHGILFEGASYLQEKLEELGVEV